MCLETMGSIALALVEDVRPGEVILSFPWLNASYRTDWVSVAMPLSGKARGFFCMPVKGDEVVVGFDRGDFDHPYVLGNVWNGTDKPPETDIDNRVLLTPGKNTLRFEDKANATKIILMSAGKHSVEIDDAAKTVTVKTDGQLRITLNDSAQSIEISGGGRTLRMAGGSVQIT